MTPTAKRRVEALETKAQVGQAAGLQVVFMNADLTEAEAALRDIEVKALEAQGHRVMRVVFVRPALDVSELH